MIKIAAILSLPWRN